MSLNLRYTRLGLMTLFSLVLLLLNSDLRAAPISECAAIEGVFDVAISHDGQLVAATWWDEGVKLWDTDTGELKHTFSDLDGTVEIELSRDGSLLLASDRDVAILWDTQDGKKLHTFELNPSNTLNSTVYFTPDGKQAITGDFFGGILWDVASGKKLRSFPGAQDTSRGEIVRLSSDANRLLTIDADPRLVYIWDVESGEKLHTFSDVINGLFSLDNRYILTRSADHLSLWDADSFALIRTFDISGLLGLNDWMFSNDGKWLLTSIEARFDVWNIETGESWIRVKAAPWDNMYGILPDNQSALIPRPGSDRRLIDVWDIASRTVNYTIDLGSIDTMIVRSFDISDDGRYLLLGAAENEIPFDRTVSLWDIQTGTKIRQYC